MNISHERMRNRLGENRELKFALERYWRGDIDQAALHATAIELPGSVIGNCKLTVDWILFRSGIFLLLRSCPGYSVMLGVIPERFGSSRDLDTYFRMARGQASDGVPFRACEMTKWFDTNYHYLVPEVDSNQQFSLSSSKLFDETRELQALGHQPKPVLLGPLTWLWLAKTTSDFNKLDLLDHLLPVYSNILQRLAYQGVEWIQIDEPILVLDLPSAWRNAFELVYNRLQSSPVKILLATYFGELSEHTSLTCKLPVAGLHIDLVRAPEQLTAVLDNFANHKVLSLGLIDGRNIWRTDLNAVLATVATVPGTF